MDVLFLNDTCIAMTAGGNGRKSNMCVYVMKRPGSGGYRDDRSQIPRRGPQHSRTRWPAVVLWVPPLLNPFQPMSIGYFLRDQ